LKAYLKENNIEADYENSYMFSDSLSDLPLLDLVGNPYLINYNKKHNIEILRWK
ncbi:HAD-IB family hydrolase, partial [Clostridium saudiense]|nr:HAD-IB family hydrolase [Clostridium saudiense]